MYDYEQQRINSFLQLLNCMNPREQPGTQTPESTPPFLFSYLKHQRFVHKIQSKCRLRLVSKYLPEQIATLAAIQLENKLNV